MKSSTLSYTAPFCPLQELRREKRASSRRVLSFFTSCNLMDCWPKRLQWRAKNDCLIFCDNFGRGSSFEGRELWTGGVPGPCTPPSLSPFGGESSTDGTRETSLWLQKLSKVLARITSVSSTMHFARR